MYSRSSLNQPFLDGLSTLLMSPTPSVQHTNGCLRTHDAGPSLWRPTPARTSRAARLQRGRDVCSQPVYDSHACYPHHGMLQEQ